MSSNTGNRYSAPRKGGNPLLAGILAGMVIGASVAAGLAWYLMKSPSPLLVREPPPGKSATDAGQAPHPAGTPDSGVNNGKPRFEFYKVLTDKQEKSVVAPVAPANKPKGTDNKPAVVFEPQLLQVGSFPKADEAEKLKAKLALLGAEATIQTADIPDKGIWYRVRLGPYKTEEELDRTRSFLKQNGVDSTPMRAK